MMTLLFLIWKHKYSQKDKRQKTKGKRQKAKDKRQKEKDKNDFFHL
jgi:hypothetical protein